MCLTFEFSFELMGNILVVPSHLIYELSKLFYTCLFYICMSHNFTFLKLSLNIRNTVPRSTLVHSNILVMSEHYCQKENLRSKREYLHEAKSPIFNLIP